MAGHGALPKAPRNNYAGRRRDRPGAGGEASGRTTICGCTSGNVSLATFGADSFIEVISAALLWRLCETGLHANAEERGTAWRWAEACSERRGFEKIAKILDVSVYRDVFR